jgi:hypothetical protein
MHDDIPPFSLFKDIVPFIILLCNIRKVYLCKKISRHAASWLFVVSNVRAGRSSEGTREGTATSKVQQEYLF